MNLPVAATGVTLTELPGKIAVYFAMGACKKHCANCHSPELSEPVHAPWSLLDVTHYAENQIDKGANAILLMGGTTNGIEEADLIGLINALSTIAPVGLYSGSDDDELHQALLASSHLTWLKTGSYQKDKGGLDSPKTNQRFYKKEIRYYGRSAFDINRNMHLLDLTHLFQKRKEKPECSI